MSKTIFEYKAYGLAAGDTLLSLLDASGNSLGSISDVGALTLPGGINATGASTITGTFHVTGAVTADSTLHAVGAVTADSTVTTTGLASLNGGFTVPTAKTGVITDADALTVGGLKVPQAIPIRHVLAGAASATAANYSVFFIADRAYTITAIAEAHTTAGSDGGGVSFVVEKLTGTQAPGGGVATMSSGIDLKGIANTVVAGALSGTPANLDLAAGDRLSLLLTGIPTSLANVCVTVTLKCK